jgi:hypothetical protein
MARLILIVAALVVLALLLGRRLRGSGEQRARVAEAAAALREQVLGGRMLAALPAREPGAVRGAVMDWGIGAGLATLVAIDDGTVSLYLNPGGGTIGAGTHPSVAQAAAAFRAEAERARGAFSPAQSHPAPGPDSVVFYLLTDSATLATTAVSMDALQGTNHPLASLGAAAQAVLTEVRRARWPPS